MGLTKTAIQSLLNTCVRTTQIGVTADRTAAIHTLIVDASAIPYVLAWIQPTSGIAIEAILRNKYITPFTGEGSKVSRIVFIVDDSTKQNKAREHFLKSIRYSAPKKIDPQKHVTVGTRVYKHGEEPVTDPDELDAVRITDEVVYPALARIINTRGPKGIGIYYQYLVKCILSFQSDALQTYIRTPTISGVDVCDGHYHTNASNPPIEGFHYGEVDLEAHALARSFGVPTAIFSSDYDHVLIALAWNNPSTIIIRKTTKLKNVSTMEWIDVAALLAAVPQRIRASLIFAVILTGTDTCQSRGISPTKTDKQIPYFIGNKIEPFVQERESGFCLDLPRLRIYIYKVVMNVDKMHYPNARGVERHYIMFPFFTTVYMFGHTPPIAFIDSKRDNLYEDDGTDAHYFPYPGAKQPTDLFWPIDSSRDNLALDYELLSPKRRRINVTA